MGKRFIPHIGVWLENKGLGHWKADDYIKGQKLCPQLKWNERWIKKFRKDVADDATLGIFKIAALRNTFFSLLEELDVVRKWRKPKFVRRRPIAMMSEQKRKELEATKKKKKKAKSQSKNQQPQHLKNLQQNRKKNKNQRDPTNQQNHQKKNLIREKIIKHKIVHKKKKKHTKSQRKNEQPQHLKKQKPKNLRQKRKNNNNQRNVHPTNQQNHQKKNLIREKILKHKIVNTNQRGKYVRG